MGEDDWDGVTEINVELRLESMPPAERNAFERNVSKRAALYSTMLLPATIGLPLSVWYCARQFVPALCRFPRSQLSYPILGAASVAWNYPKMKSMGYVMETLNVLREDIPKGALNVRWGKFENIHVSVDKSIAIRLQLPAHDGSEREPRQVDTETYIFDTETAETLKKLEYGILYAISLASLTVSSPFLLLGAKRQFFPQLRIIRCVALGLVLYVGISYLVNKYTNKRNFAVIAFESRRKPLEQGTDEKDLNKFVRQVQIQQVGQHQQVRVGHVQIGHVQDEQVQQHVRQQVGQARQQVQQARQQVQEARQHVQQQVHQAHQQVRQARQQVRQAQQQIQQQLQHAQQVRVQQDQVGQVQVRIGDGGQVHIHQDGQIVQIQQDGQQVRIRQNQVGQVQQIHIEQDGQRVHVVQQGEHAQVHIEQDGQVRVFVKTSIPKTDV